MVILPTSNEAANIGALLERLLYASGLDEVADGGSNGRHPGTCPFERGAARALGGGQDGPPTRTDG